MLNFVTPHRFLGQSQTFEELSAATEAIWAADVNRFPSDEVVYDLGSDA